MAMARIAFIQPLSFEYPGTEWLSAVLKADGHEVRVFIQGEKGCASLDKWIGCYNPHIAGFSCTTGLHQWALDKASLIKQKFPSILTVFGGPHPTHFPEIIEHESVDAICRGEGEYALLELTRAISNNNDFSSIANLWVKRDGKIVRNDVRSLIIDLDTLPFPDRSIYLDRYNSLHASRKSFFIGRGCPYSCAYCFNSAQREIYKGKGAFVRLRSPENVLNEIISVRNKYGLRTVYFQDDTFTLDWRWLTDFLPKYRERIGLPFICLITADKATDEMVKMLKDAGCIRAFFGVESGDEQLRRKVLKKNISDEQIRNAALRLRKNGIRFRTYNMIGLPGERIEQVFKTVALNAEIRTDYPWCSLYFPFPGTELTESAIQKGLIDRGDTESLPYTYFQDSHFQMLQHREMINLHNLFVYAVKFPFLIRIIRKLITLPSNRLFRLAFLFSYGYCYMKSEDLGLIETMMIGIRSLFRLFPGSVKNGKKRPSNKAGSV
jgi:anaerobic magnesium-protoporphyrin IX monomethyl ester cyclase